MGTSDLPNIGKVLEHYGATLNRSSGRGPCKCPFHHDTHASAGVDFTKNLFNCFTCGVGGNSLQIIMNREGVDIREASSISERITGESNKQIRGEYSSGSRLPGKSRNNKVSSTSGAIRRSRES